jgi:hypothetical protein
LLTIKVLNLNQEFSEGRPKGHPMQGARATRCLPAAPALPDRPFPASHGRIFARERRF